MDLIKELKKGNKIQRIINTIPEAFLVFDKKKIYIYFQKQIGSEYILSRQQADRQNMYVCDSVSWD